MPAKNRLVPHSIVLPMVLRGARPSGLPSSKEYNATFRRFPFSSIMPTRWGVSASKALRAAQATVSHTTHLNLIRIRPVCGNRMLMAFHD